jgi:acyl-CoA-binding protein
MSDLEKRFETAAQEANRLPSRPDNETLLKLYALFKQAKNGDVSGKRPGFTDLTGRAKWDAWQKVKGMSREMAMESYIHLVETLKK